jgi:transcriptional regulator with XRE-family HTH domain
MEFEEYKKRLAERIKALRKERNMNQEELAEKLGTNHTHVVRMEKGTQDFRLSSLLKIAAAFEIEIGELVSF